MKIISLSNLPEEGVSHNPEIKKKVMLRAGEIPHLSSFSQVRFRSGQVADVHAHDDMYEVFFVEEGEGIIRVENKEYRLERGVCIVVEPGEVHEIINKIASEVVITYFGLKVDETEFREIMKK